MTGERAAFLKEIMENPIKLPNGMMKLYVYSGGKVDQRSKVLFVMAHDVLGLWNLATDEWSSIKLMNEEKKLFHKSKRCRVICKCL